MTWCLRFGNRLAFGFPCNLHINNLAYEGDKFPNSEHTEV